MTKEDALRELELYKKYELKKLKIVDSADEFDTIQQVFVGPKNSATFREFYKVFLSRNYSPLVINSFAGSPMAIYFLINSGQDEDYLSLDTFLQSYENL